MSTDRDPNVRPRGEMISWDVPMVHRLNVAYQAAIVAQLEGFEFEGHKLLTAYAGYLIEHLSTTFRARGVWFDPEPTV